MTQDFGGEWTREKLQVLKIYSALYTRALKKGTSFRLHCIDAFAGTGEVNIKTSTKKTRENIEGSMEILRKHGFDTFHFIELDEDKAKILGEKIAKSNIKDKSTIYTGDANQVIPKILANFNNQRDRVLLFLDPWGLAVEMDTLVKISRKPICDVIYLFPSSIILRAIPHKSEGRLQVKMKGKALQCFGMTEKELTDLVYKESPQTDMFKQRSIERDANIDKIEKILIAKLKEKAGFAYVHPTPKRLLKGAKGPVLFSLIFCASNPSKNAITLIRKFATYSFQ
ncbi:MAG: three-Cys-motif partner protein TcmP [Alphaproteobacteria bacterium]|nr:three-Cys-motif partner protein TcmP [Alphaproteobacteria bacterium]